MIFGSLTSSNIYLKKKISPLNYQNKKLKEYLKENEQIRRTAEGEVKNHLLLEINKLNESVLSNKISKKNIIKSSKRKSDKSSKSLFKSNKQVLGNYYQNKSPSRLDNSVSRIIMNDYSRVEKPGLTLNNFMDQSQLDNSKIAVNCLETRSNRKYSNSCIKPFISKGNNNNNNSNPNTSNIINNIQMNNSGWLNFNDNTNQNFLIMDGQNLDSCTVRGMHFNTSNLNTNNNNISINNIFINNNQSNNINNINNINNNKYSKPSTPSNDMGVVLNSDVFENDQDQIGLDKEEYLDTNQNLIPRKSKEVCIFGGQKLTSIGSDVTGGLLSSSNRNNSYLNAEQINNNINTNNTNIIDNSKVNINALHVKFKVQKRNKLSSKAIVKDKQIKLLQDQALKNTSNINRINKSLMEADLICSSKEFLQNKNLVQMNHNTNNINKSVLEGQCISSKDHLQDNRLKLSLAKIFDEKNINSNDGVDKQIMNQSIYNNKQLSTNTETNTNTLDRDKNFNKQENNMQISNINIYSNKEGSNKNSKLNCSIKVPTAKQESAEENTPSNRPLLVNSNSDEESQQRRIISNRNNNNNINNINNLIEEESNLGSNSKERRGFDGELDTSIVKRRSKVKKMKTLINLKAMETEAVTSETGNFTINEPTKYKIINFRQLTIINKVYDSLSDDEDVNMENVNKPSALNIDPDSKVLLCLDIILFFAITYILLFLPIKLAFRITRIYPLFNEEFIASLVLDVVFTSRLLINFLTGFHSEDQTVFSYRMIFTNYVLFGGFFIDLLVSLPVQTILTVMQFSKYSELKTSNPRLEDELIINYLDQEYFNLKLLLWLRLLVVFKLKGLIDRMFEEQRELYPNFGKIITSLNMFFIIIYSLNIVTSLWIFIGNSNSSAVGLSWISRFNFQSESQFSVYVASLYFSVVTIFTIGYGDIYATTISEQLYVTIFLMLSNTVFSLIVSWLSSTVSRSSIKEELFHNKEQVLKRIVEEFKITEELEDKLRKSINVMKKNFIEDKEELMGILPEILKVTMYKNLYQHRIKTLSFFRDKSEEFILYCAPHLILQKPGARDFIIGYGELFNEMFILNKGSLNFYLGQHLAFYKIIKMNKGYHFGDVYMFSKQPSDYSIKSSGNHCEIYSLKKDIVDDLNHNFPEIMDNILKKSLDEFYELELLRNEAFLFFDEFKTMDGFRNYVIMNQVNEENEKLNREMVIEQFRKNNNCGYLTSSTSSDNKIALMSQYVLDEGNTADCFDNSNANRLYGLGSTAKLGSMKKRLSHHKLNTNSNPLNHNFSNKEVVNYSTLNISNFQRTLNNDELPLFVSHKAQRDLLGSNMHFDINNNNNNECCNINNNLLSTLKIQQDSNTNNFGGKAEGEGRLACEFGGFAVIKSSCENKKEMIIISKVFKESLKTDTPMVCNTAKRITLHLPHEKRALLSKQSFLEDNQRKSLLRQHKLETTCKSQKTRISFLRVFHEDFLCMENLFVFDQNNNNKKHFGWTTKKAFNNTEIDSGKESGWLVDNSLSQKSFTKKDTLEALATHSQDYLGLNPSKGILEKYSFKEAPVVAYFSLQNVLRLDKIGNLLKTLKVASNENTSKVLKPNSYSKNTNIIINNNHSKCETILEEEYSRSNILLVSENNIENKESSRVSSKDKDDYFRPHKSYNNYTFGKEGNSTLRAKRSGETPSLSSFNLGKGRSTNTILNGPEFSNNLNSSSFALKKQELHVSFGQPFNESKKSIGRKSISYSHFSSVKSVNPNKDKDKESLLFKISPQKEYSRKKHLSTNNTNNFVCNNQSTQNNQQSGLIPLLNSAYFDDNRQFSKDFSNKFQSTTNNNNNNINYEIDTNNMRAKSKFSSKVFFDDNKLFKLKSPRRNSFKLNDQTVFKSTKQLLNSIINNFNDREQIKNKTETVKYSPLICNAFKSINDKKTPTSPAFYLNKVLRKPQNDKNTNNQAPSIMQLVGLNKDYQQQQQHFSKDSPESNNIEIDDNEGKHKHINSAYFLPESPDPSKGKFLRRDQRLRTTNTKEGFTKKIENKIAQNNFYSNNIKFLNTYFKDLIAKNTEIKNCSPKKAEKGSVAEFKSPQNTKAKSASANSNARKRRSTFVKKKTLIGEIQEKTWSLVQQNTFRQKK